MFFYDIPAPNTFKSIPKFSYELYTNLAINGLKYNNDSSAIVRVIDSITSATRESFDDLPYTTVLAITGMNYRQIDRFNRFALDQIPGIDFERNEENIICYSHLKGYSKYTDLEYDLHYIKDKNDFIRHSYPCDCFINKSVPTAQPRFITLIPNIWENVNCYVGSSAITIKPIGIMDSSSIGVIKQVTVTVEGINIRNELIEEDIDIQYFSEFITFNEFIKITKMKALNTKVSFDIIFYPYINGREVLWNQVMIDREEFDRKNVIVKYNLLTKELEYYIIHNESISFPIYLELNKRVKTNLHDRAIVYDYFIDQDNGLLYILTDGNNLYCFPFIIPGSYNSRLDSLKTIQQACRIEYFEDSVNKKYYFEVFPTSKTNDVDALDIYINDTLYKEGIVLDLFREKLIDNRIEIPFEDLFDWRSASLIEFKTFGVKNSNYPISITNPVIEPLYVKDLSAITNYNETTKGSEYVSSCETSSKVKYPNSKINNGLEIAPTTNIYKLSKYGNVIIDGYLITDIFQTFYFSEDDLSIITQDTITNIRVN